MKESKQDFLSAANDWICDGYALDIRYIALPAMNFPTIVSASIRIDPLKPKADNSIRIHTANILAGQVQKYPVGKEEISQILLDATEGKIRVDKLTLTLGDDHPLDYYSEMTQRDRWYSELHLRIGGTATLISSPQVLNQIDNDLRCATTPFDGLFDLAGWLGLDANAFHGERPTVTVRIGPPADLIFDRSKLYNDNLSLEIHAHPLFDIKQLTLAARSMPGNGIAGRRQLTSEITWGDSIDGKKIGTISTTLPSSDNVLTMLLIGTSTVRRQWLIDAGKARNNRWMAVQQFDNDLRKVRSAVLEPIDSRKFESGVASLLFLLGFSPSLQAETDAPDLIVSTPGGQLVIIECTTRIADFSAKLGKLVDRCSLLSKSLLNAGHPPEILAALICGVEKDQIASRSDELRAHKVLLLTKEDLQHHFDRVRHPEDPDKFVSEAKLRLNSDAALSTSKLE